MTTVQTTFTADELQQAARNHLWLHFTRMGGYLEGELPVIVRGEGCYLEDINGKRYLDALAGLFAVQIGYSYGDEIGEAAAGVLEVAAVSPDDDRELGIPEAAHAREVEPEVIARRALELVV